MSKQRVRIGWIGYTDGKPYFGPTVDSYCSDGQPVFVCDIFRSKRAALKRFEDVRALRLPVERLPRKGRAKK